MSTRRYAIAAAIGLVAGITGGLFGVGGGIVVVPGLVLLLGYLPHRAHPTSGAAIVVTAGAALLRFGEDGSVDWSAALVLFAGAGLGALLGARMLDRISARWLTRAFLLVVAVSAVRLLTPSRGNGTADFAMSVDLTLWAIAGLLTVGLLAGVLAATLGVGGGVVFVPALAAFYLLDQHVAQGTSLAAMVPTTLVAAVVHGRAGRIEWPVAAAVGVGGVIGGLTGAGWALSMDPLLLRRLFAGLLIVLGLRMLFAQARSQQAKLPPPRPPLL